MIAQRKGADLDARKTVADFKAERGAARSSTSVSMPNAQKRKLSFKEKHALETLPGQIDKLNADIARLQNTLATPNLFTKDVAVFNAAAADLKKAENKLAKAEEQWLELEMLREELAG